jgi:poly(A) polymerase Pap1
MLTIVFAALVFAALRTYSAETTEKVSPSRALARSILDSRGALAIGGSRMQTDLVLAVLVPIVFFSALRCWKQMRSRR